MIQQVIRITDIQIEQDRTREDFGDIDSLAMSFKEDGIIQPIAVVALSEESEYKYKLLAGERRCRAAQVAKIDTIPARIYDKDLSDLQMKSIELAENYYRKDFTWQEESKLKSDIHNLQVQQYGEKTTTNKGTPEEIGWSQKDTAILLNESPSTLSRDIKLAHAMDVIPELSECKTKGDAQKLLLKMEEEQIRQELAKRHRDQVAKNPENVRNNIIINNYIICDFLGGVKSVPDNSVNLIEVDPPYAIDLVKSKKGGNISTRGYNEIEASQYITFIRQVIKECYRVLSNDGWLIFWFAPHPWFEDIYQEIYTSGFKIRRMPCIWSKGTGQTKQANYHLPNSYEMFFYANKGDARISRPRSSNVFTYQPVTPQNKIHPTERPIALIEDILNTFAFEGSRIMVPFLGSGATMLAALNLNMDCFGFDLTELYKDSFTIKIYEDEKPYVN